MVPRSRLLVVKRLRALGQSMSGMQCSLLVGCRETDHAQLACDLKSPTDLAVRVGRSRALDAVLLQTEVAEAGMTVGSAAERSVVLALALLDRKVVD
jgi:hypothetical protein